MEKEINRLLSAHENKIRANYAYELLGRFGTRLPQNILDELRETAEAETRLFDAKITRLKNNL